MPKMKSNRGAKKRFKVSGTGKLIRKKQGANHLLAKKSIKRKRNLRHSTTVHESDEKRVARLLNLG